MGRREMTQALRQAQSFRSRAFGLRALVVDFDSGSIENVSSFLKELGMEVLTAKDGLSGLEVYRTRQPQIVLLEAMLPKMSGFELCKQIQIESRGKVPVIMITGIYKDVRHKIEATQTYGAAAFLTKPWKREDLEKTVLGLIGPEIKSPIEEEDLITESLNDLNDIIKKGLPLTGPPSPPKAEPKEVITKKAIPGSDDVDRLLEKTLADLGFGTKKPVSQEKKPAAASPAKPPEVKITEPKPKEAESPIKQEKLKQAPQFPEAPAKITPPQVSGEVTKETTKKIAEISEMKAEKEIPKPKDELKPEKLLLKTPLKEEEKKERREEAMEEKREKEGTGGRQAVTTPSVFETAEASQKRPSPPLLLGVTAAVVLTLTAVLVFKPKKHASPPPTQEVAMAPQATSDAATLIPSRLEEQETAAKTPRLKEPIKPSPNQTSPPPDKKEETAAEEEAPPVLVAETPNLILPVPAVKIENEPQPKPDLKPGQPEPSPVTPKPEATPSPQIKEGDLVPLEEVDLAPKAVKTVEPKYPPLAQQIGLEGSVVVNALISEKGDVIRTEILRGIKNGASLEQAAEAAIRQWKFTPAEKNGVKVKVWKPIETRFRLRQ